MMMITDILIGFFFGLAFRRFMELRTLGKESKEYESKSFYMYTFLFIGVCIFLTSEIITRVF